MADSRLGLVYVTKILFCKSWGYINPPNFVLEGINCSNFVGGAIEPFCHDHVQDH